MSTDSKTTRLKKELGLFDVYAISTGAMFSSGFFLLPGLAAAKAGPSVVLAYMLAGVLILPAMFSKAELATAMPRAGGTYYFLDRSLGPMVGTVGGLGTFLALTLKSAFALVGMGAYLAFFVHIPIKPLAIGLTCLFMVINIVGAKETTGLQRFLVIVLLSVLAFFVIQGLFQVGNDWGTPFSDAQLTPFLPFGFEGLLGTVGFVFVSYAGLTKVASVAEEIKNPDRNIPLGMMLSLATATFVYVVGVFILVMVLEPSALHEDLTPVATAAESFFSWLPQPYGLLLIVAAAIAAFASTGNAGLLSASRYPLAMARDRLLPSSLANLGRFHTPTIAILLTTALMILCIVVLDEEGIAKLASAFQLFIFMLVNLAVIVMRESKISSYDPGYRSPLYPWIQIFGIITPVILIGYMGWLAVAFTLGMIVFCLIWYKVYARDRVVRDGAIYHWFERLGKRRFEGLDTELRTILKEKGLREHDPFEEVVARAAVMDAKGQSFQEVTQCVSELLEIRIPGTASEIADELMQGKFSGATPVADGIGLPHIQIAGLKRPELVLVRSTAGLKIPGDGDLSSEEVFTAHALFYLASPKEDPGQHLRILAQIAGRADEENFLEEWKAASDESDIKALLLRDQRFLSLPVKQGKPSAALINQPLMATKWPEGCLVALIRRNGETIVPSGQTIVQEGDVLTIIGSTDGVRELRSTYV